MKKLFCYVCLPMIVFACNAGPGASPKKTLDKFLDAMEKGNFTEAKKYATDDSQSFLNMISKSDNGADEVYKNKDLVVTDEETINGNEADVQVKDESGTRLNFHLKKEGGEWKVQFNMGAIINMAKDVIKKAGVDVQKEVNQAIDSIKINIDSLH